MPLQSVTYVDLFHCHAVAFTGVSLCQCCVLTNNDSVFCKVQCCLLGALSGRSPNLTQVSTEWNPLQWLYPAYLSHSYIQRSSIIFLGMNRALSGPIRE